VISGQNAQPAGEDRQAFGNTELSGKVSNQQFILAVVATVPATLSGNIKLQRVCNSPHVRQKRVIRCGRFQCVLIHSTQEKNRVVP
jgi:hypothetical protein